MQKINIITNDLSEIKASDKDLFGAKASLLAAVHGHGYGTPGGYALSLPRRSPIEAEELLAMVEDCTGPTAVRSSSVWEDGASASGAGCFLTRLHCVGSDAILQAVIDVYTHAKGVADAQGLDGDRIGVLIQPMVPGSISGVCFTSHGESPDQLVLEYTQGECRQVVDGCAGTQHRSFPHQNIACAEGTLGYVAQQCWGLRQAMGEDLDIEWTLTPEGQLVILQARPITSASPERIWQRAVSELQAEPDDVLTSLSIGEVFGRPKPLFRDLMAEALRAGGPLSPLFAKFGLGYAPQWAPCFTVFCTRPYINISAYARSLGLDIRVRVDAQGGIRWRLWNPRSLWRLARCCLRLPRLQRLYLDSVEDRIASLPKQGADWETAKQHMLDAFIPLHLEADVLSAVYHGLLMKVLTVLCRSEKRAMRVYETLSFGLTNPNIETNLDLYRLATSTLSWDDFVARQGQRGQPDWDIAAPRFWEQPDAIQSLAGRLLDGSASPLQREQRRQRKSALLDRMLKKHWWYRRLRPYLEENARLIFYRERTQHLLYRQVDSLRRIAMGKGLGEEVFFLHCDEVDAPPPQSVVRERRKRYVQERSQPAPTTFVAHSPKPAPPTVRTEGLHGLPISQGVYEGNAYIAESLEHALQMPEGSVLLVQHVDPAWSPVLYLAGAIVCEQGGLFCHSSILIRELGIPAVAKVPHACTSVHNGARVRVDGTSGFVSIIESKIPS